MKQLWTYVVLIVMVYSCSNEGMEIGSSMVESSARTVLIDTCTVTLTTVKIDSLITSGKGVIYNGKIDSELRGKVSSKSFVSFLSPSYTEYRKNMTTPLVFDSLVLEMNFNSSFYGDTLSRHKLDLHLLKKALELPSSNAYYNTSVVSYLEDVYASISFTPRPSRGDALRIKLSNTFGEDLLSKLANNLDEIQTDEKFQNYFTGFAFVSDENSKAIFGYDVNESSTIIKLYYHFVEVEKKEYEVTISPNTSTNFFSVVHDREDSPLENLQDGYQGLSSSKSDNIAYLHGALGYYARLEFPFLRDLLTIGQAGNIISAQMYIYPIENSFNQHFKLPEQLNLYIADDTNSNVDAVTNSYGTELQTGNLFEDELITGNTYYSFSITSFLQEQLPAIGLHKKKLHLTLPESEMNQSFNSLLFGDRQHPNQRIKVNIIYSVYE